MNQQLKTVLLTVLTLSVFVIALVELSGVSKTALLNKFKGDDHHTTTATATTTGVGLNASIPKTRMEFEETKHSFGTITDGDVVTHAYKFKNTGDNPLVISNAIASCGCTVPSYPKQPIAPGGSGEIVVQFNSRGKVGHQQKNVLINSNAEEAAMSIGFDADVKAK
jgi:hypothetical protein